MKWFSEFKQRVTLLWCCEALNHAPWADLQRGLLKGKAPQGSSSLLWALLVLSNSTSLTAGDMQLEPCSSRNPKLCSKPKRGQGALKLEAVPQRWMPQSRGLVRTLTVPDVASSVNSAVALYVGSTESTPHTMMLFNGFRHEYSPSDVIL